MGCYFSISHEIPCEENRARDHLIVPCERRFPSFVSPRWRKKKGTRHILSWSAPRIAVVLVNLYLVSPDNKDVLLAHFSGRHNLRSKVTLRIVWEMCYTVGCRPKCRCTLILAPFLIEKEKKLYFFMVLNMSRPNTANKRNIGTDSCLGFPNLFTIVSKSPSVGSLSRPGIWLITWSAERCLKNYSILKTRIKHFDTRKETTLRSLYLHARDSVP